MSSQPSPSRSSVDGMESHRAERRPKLRVLRCIECGELHLDSVNECALECDAGMEEVEVVAVDRLEAAVDERDALTRAFRRLFRQRFGSSPTNEQVAMYVNASSDAGGR